MSYGYPPYVPVAERRAKAQRQMERLAKKGQVISPVRIEGRSIASTFWGKAWCENLERYSDYSNRLPRGRTYVRNGSVVDLQILRGKIEARVSGSSIYRVAITIDPLPQARWQKLCEDCSGAIDSLVELLQGRFSKGVMERVCEEGKGLFPSPAEIELSCSCPDWADMCKHVAATLYGVGARLDEKPELLFLLRGVDPAELLAHAASDMPLGAPAPSDLVLEGDDLAELFGLEMAEAVPSAKPKAQARKKPGPRAKAAASVEAKAVPKRAVKKPKTASDSPRKAAPVKKAPGTKAKPRAKRSGVIG
ncbi:SWIM zinc finger family protein [Holophaga foetida]|uniref:SWIM zinc finger family protein n=1 Tax=Holophaga foetida TaxID=35839 RepID=UPI00024717C5|nr:SWIM zinc finger family protein [Holophaga foetida]